MKNKIEERFRALAPIIAETRKKEEIINIMPPANNGGSSSDDDDDDDKLHSSNGKKPAHTRRKEPVASGFFLNFCKKFEEAKVENYGAAMERFATLAKESKCERFVFLAAEYYEAEEAIIARYHHPSDPSITIDYYFNKDEQLYKITNNGAKNVIMPPIISENSKSFTIEGISANGKDKFSHKQDFGFQARINQQKINTRGEVQAR